MGIFVAAFFGLCAAVAALTIRRKLRDRNFAGDLVRLPGGVDITIDVRRMMFLAAAILVIGLLLVFVVERPPIHVFAIGIFLVAVGLVLLVGHLLTLLPRRTLRFDPDGITFGYGKYKALVDWTNISQVTAGSYADNPIVLLELTDVRLVSIEPEASRRKFHKQVAQNRTYFGADLSIVASTFGVDGIPLAAAILRYANNPEARAELIPAVPRLQAPADKTS